MQFRDRAEAGRKLAEKLKDYANRPVVILSGSPEEAKIAQGYELGVNSYVVKPQNGEQFRQVVRQIGTY